MSFQKISVFLTALLALAAMVVAVVMYVQLSEIQELREDMTALQQASEVENQGLREELASLRTEMAELDSSEDLAAINQSISRLRLQNLGVWVDDEPLVSLQIPQIARPGLSVSNMPSLQPDVDWWWEQYPDTVRTITRNDYGSAWPFETDEALLGCHGGDVLVVVELMGEGNVSFMADVMVDSATPDLHDFMADMSLVSVFDPSSLEFSTVRERMIEEAQSLCDVRVVR
jgi:hypothetical protein